MNHEGVGEVVVLKSATDLHLIGETFSWGQGQVFRECPTQCYSENGLENSLELVTWMQTNNSFFSCFLPFLYGDKYEKLAQQWQQSSAFCTASKPDLNSFLILV